MKEKTGLEVKPWEPKFVGICALSAVLIVGLGYILFSIPPADTQTIEDMVMLLMSFTGFIGAFSPVLYFMNFSKRLTILAIVYFVSVILISAASYFVYSVLINGYYLNMRRVNIVAAIGIPLLSIVVPIYYGFFGWQAPWNSKKLTSAEPSVGKETLRDPLEIEMLQKRQNVRGPEPVVVSPENQDPRATPTT